MPGVTSGLRPAGEIGPSTARRQAEKPARVGAMYCIPQNRNLDVLQLEVVRRRGGCSYRAITPRFSRWCALFSQLMDSVFENGAKAGAGFIDYTAAFDSVCRERQTLRQSVERRAGLGCRKAQVSGR